MQTDMILDALVMDVQPPVTAQPAQEYVWLRDPVTGDEVAYPVEMENSISILMLVGYRIFVPSEVKS